MVDEEGHLKPIGKRRLTWLEKIGVGGTILGSLTVVGVMKDQFWTREEGVAGNVAITEIKAQMVLNNAELTRVIERKVDRILEFMKEDRITMRREIDHMDNRLENVELVVQIKPKKRGDK